MVQGSTPSILHREDGPAVEFNGGFRSWYVNGRLHRVDGPASIAPDGDTRWCINGQLHRDGGPAITISDGTEMWYQYGKLHRTDGPAHSSPNSPTILHRWFLNGKRHRLDGPAIVYGPTFNFSSVDREYYVNGILCRTKPEYARAVARWLSYKELTRDEIASLIGNFRIVEWN